MRPEVYNRLEKDLMKLQQVPSRLQHSEGE